MDFFALISFLALYYLRPQEWVPDFSSLHPIQLLSVLAIWAMFQKENYKRLLQTPLDWLMLTYFIWTLIAGFQFRQTLSGIQSVLLFYFVGVCSLDTIPRLKKFLGWWCVFIFIIAALAVASQYGFDPFGSYDITMGQMKGRLMLNLSIFDNPNALAHSIVPAIPLFYYLVYWRQVIMKASVLLLAVPLYCIYLTVSKGAFICGFATLLATLTFGRSKVWQIVIVVTAILFGSGLLFMLPRMNELSHSKTDPAIQGRVAALTYGLQLMRTNFFGIGLGNFQNDFLHSGPLESSVIIRSIPARKVGGGPDSPAHELNSVLIRRMVWRHFSKATHGAYNQNGAELGYVGLYLFVGILYCCIRTLLLVKSRDDDEERIRRALFAMVVAYAASSWMVDFCYRPTFFMMVAATSAFHRHLLRKHDAGPVVEEKPLIPGKPWLRRLPPIKMPGIPLPDLAGLPGLAAPVAAGSAACLPQEAAGPSLASTATMQAALVAPPGSGASGGRALPWHKTSTLEATLRKKFKWTRLGFLDFFIILILTYAAIQYWQHLIATM